MTDDDRTLFGNHHGYLSPDDDHRAQETVQTVRTLLEYAVSHGIPLDWTTLQVHVVTDTIGGQTHLAVRAQIATT